MITRSYKLVFVLFAFFFVDLTVGLPTTYYTEADDHSYRTKPCTSNPTPETLQQVVSSASPGDIICLQPGVLYPEFTIDVPQGSNDYITIRNANLSLLPPPGVRISPLYAPYLPMLDGGVTIMQGSRYRFVGLYFIAPQNITYFSLFQTSATSDHIIVDQCYSKYLQAQSAGFYTLTLVGNHIAFMNSYIEDRSFGTMIVDCHVLKVTNNYFDNYDTFFMTADVPAVTSDFEIRFNYFQKKSDVLNYFGLLFTPGTSRVWFDSNYIAASSPADGVISDAIGCRTMEDITITNNYFDTCSRGLALDASTPNTPTSSVVVYGNFFANITSTPFYLAAGMASYNFSENTIIGDPTVMSSFISFFLVNATDVDVTAERNIASAGLYGITLTLADKIYNLLPADKLTWSDNVMVVGNPFFKSKFPSVGTIFEDSLDNVSFVDPSRMDYQLLSTSPYSKANYGKQMGVDLCALVRSAKLKFVLTNCSLTDVVIQPTEILVITDVLTVNGNLTMFPDSILKVDGVNVLNITSCAQFDGTLDLTNVNQLINQTIVVAYYSCWTGGEFKDITYDDQTSDDCNKLKVELNYQPTLVTATIVLENQCQTPSGQNIGQGPGASGNNGPGQDNPNAPVTNLSLLPDWFLPVVIVGGAVFLTLVFIVLAVSVPALKQRVFHKKRRYPDLS